MFGPLGFLRMYVKYARYVFICSVYVPLCMRVCMFVHVYVRMSRYARTLCMYVMCVGVYVCTLCVYARMFFVRM